MLELAGWKSPGEACVFAPGGSRKRFLQWKQLVSFEPLLLLLANKITLALCLRWGWSRSYLSTPRYRDTDIYSFFLAYSPFLQLTLQTSCWSQHHCLLLNYVLNHLLFNTLFWEDSTSKAVLEISTIGNAVGDINTWASLNWANHGTGRCCCCNVEENVSKNMVKKEPIYWNTSQTVKAAYDHYLGTLSQSGEAMWSTRGLNLTPTLPAPTSLALPAIPGPSQSAKSFCS